MEIDTIESIALGANQGISYENYEAMVTALNAMESTKLHNGQNIHIGTLNVPDFWIYSVEDTYVEYSYVDDETLINELQSFPQIGYYRLSQLETQKVDLTEYAKTEDVAEEISKSLDGKTLKVLSEENYNNLTEEEKADESVIYLYY